MIHSRSDIRSKIYLSITSSFICNTKVRKYQRGRILYNGYVEEPACKIGDDDYVGYIYVLEHRELPQVIIESSYSGKFVNVIMRDVAITDVQTTIDNLIRDYREYADLNQKQNKEIYEHNLTQLLQPSKSDSLLLQLGLAISKMLESTQLLDIRSKGII